MNDRQGDRVKLFGMTVQMIEAELDSIEKKLNVDLGRGSTADVEKDEGFYLQFDERVRREAAAMAKHYELFYCLEKSIRAIVSEKLKTENALDWWNTLVPSPVRENVARNIAREAEAGVTRRSEENLDYTTFGELGEIVKANWDVFSDQFNSEKAFGRVMASLNMLRGPIAHCSPLAPDEVDRLELTLKDWFRLME